MSNILHKISRIEGGRQPLANSLSGCVVLQNAEINLKNIKYDTVLKLSMSKKMTTEKHEFFTLKKFIVKHLCFLFICSRNLFIVLFYLLNKTTKVLFII